MVWCFESEFVNQITKLTLDLKKKVNICDVTDDLASSRCTNVYQLQMCGYKPEPTFFPHESKVLFLEEEGEGWTYL